MTDESRTLTLQHLAVLGQVVVIRYSAATVALECGAPKLARGLLKRDLRIAAQMTQDLPPKKRPARSLHEERFGSYEDALAEVYGRKR